MSYPYITVELPVGQIDYPDRDRPETDMGDMEGLVKSIADKGLLHAVPVLYDRHDSESVPTLIAGFRRLTAYRFLNNLDGAVDNRYSTIPCRIYSGLTPLQCEQIMHEENLHREDLSWQASAIAVYKYHENALALDENWTMADTASSLNYSAASIRTVSERINVARVLINPENNLRGRVIECPGLRTASNLIKSHARKQIDADITDFLVDEHNASVGAASPPPQETTEFGPDDIDLGLEEEETLTEVQPKKDNYIRNAGRDIHNDSFFDWVETYTGTPFDVIHFDPPYGVGMDKSDQASSAIKNAYADDEGAYWDFLHGVRANAPKIIKPNAHMIQWFSMKFYTETLDFYTRWAMETERDIRVNPFPLIWWKNDNMGLVPDHQRYGRRVYETAFLISFGDRKISAVNANLFDCPSGAKGGDRLHMSMKPEEMLIHFLAPLVDESVHFFDPCCGSATSLAAAEYCGARSVTGLEIDEENFRTAKAVLNRRRLILTGDPENLEEARTRSAGQLAAAGV